MSDLTASDVLAMTKTDNGMFGSSGATWLIILILFFLGGMGGGFGFGNSTAEYATRSDVQDLITSNSIQNNMTNGLSALNQNFSNGVAGINQNISNGVAGLNQTMNAIASNQALAMNTGFNSVNSNLQTLGSQMAECCCSIKTEIGNKISEVENLINNNTIQDLRDKLSNAKNETFVTGLTAAQAIQTNTLENFMRDILKSSSTTSSTS